MSFVTIWVFEFFHNKFLSLVTIWVEFYHNEFLSFVTIWVFRFVAIGVFEFCHNLIFCVLSQFEFWVLSQFEFMSFVTIWGLKFRPNLSLICHNLREKSREKNCDRMFCHFCHYCHYCHYSLFHKGVRQTNRPTDNWTSRAAQGS